WHRPRISAYGGAVHACFGLRCKTDGYDSNRSFHGWRFYGMIQINDTAWPRAQSIITRILASKKEREAIRQRSKNVAVLICSSVASAYCRVVVSSCRSATFSVRAYLQRCLFATSFCRKTSAGVL